MLVETTFIRFVEINIKTPKVEGAVRDYFNEYPVKKVWKFEERVEDSLRKSHNNSWFAEAVSWRLD